jgi:2'-5' RNA ligase
MENVHLSLCFLGNIIRPEVKQVCSVLDMSTGSLKPFSLDINGIGTFGKRNSPRVIWAGVSESDALSCLQVNIRGLLKERGFSIEKRPFIPHLTLGRVRSSRGRIDLLNVLKSVKNEYFGRFSVTRAVLMKSVLSSRGAEYSLVHEGLLGAECD